MIWPVSLAIVVWFVATDDMIGYALLITAGSFLVAFAFLGWSTWLTSRRDRRAAPESGPDPP